MSKTAVFTSATYTYLSRSRTLAETVKRFHPDWHMCLMLPDLPPSGVTVDWGNEIFDSVIKLDDLEIQNLKSWSFRHNVVELCTAVKGFALKKLQERGFEKVFYIDPDIALFSPLDTLQDLLDHNSILLTPHQIEPESTDQGVIDNEWTSLKFGVYNLGFVGVRSDKAGREFAGWWAERLRFYCREDVPNGLFTDQRWCDLVPALFDRVHVIRDPGYNVASWNISKRKVIIRSDGSIYVNDSPLRFFHFSKVDHIGETMLRRYAGRDFDVIELMYWYRRKLKQHNLDGVPNRWWIYGQYEDGTPIHPNSRLKYGQLGDACRRFPNPFAVGPECFRDWEASSA